MARNEFDKNFAKAIRFDYLSHYYKYSNPELHIKYYKKHLHYFLKTLEDNHDNQRDRSKNPGAIRILHGACQTDNVDVFINGNKIFQDVAYQQLTNYLSVPPGFYFIDVYPAGTQIQSLQTRKIIVAPEKKQTIAFAGAKANEKLIPYKDQICENDGNAKLRFVHLMKDTGPVDIQLKNSNTLKQQMPYRTTTDYLGLKPAPMQFEVLDHLTKEVLLTIPSTPFMENHQYQIFLTGNRNSPDSLTYVLAE